MLPPEKDEGAEVLLVCSAHTSLARQDFYGTTVRTVQKDVTPRSLKILIFRNRFNGIERESFEKHEEMLFLSSKALRVFFLFFLLPC